MLTVVIMTLTLETRWLGADFLCAFVVQGDFGAQGLCSHFNEPVLLLTGE